MKNFLLVLLGALLLTATASAQLAHDPAAIGTMVCTNLAVAGTPSVIQLRDDGTIGGDLIGDWNANPNGAPLNLTLYRVANGQVLILKVHLTRQIAGLITSGLPMDPHATFPLLTTLDSSLGTSSVTSMYGVFVNCVR